jgi:muramoyltetrapeptide carboxypeptidase LdcA involved in peptidoglycan recycling
MRDGPIFTASCKKHVENMLKSPATQFENESTIRVVKSDAENFDVAGGVHSANASGQPIGGNFNCHAQLIGGAVWSTKTSLDFAR